MCISQDIFTTYKNRSETWIVKNFPEFHSFIFSTSNEQITWREKLFIYHNGLLSVPECKCGSKVKFIDIIKGYRKYCSNKCKSNDPEFKSSVEKTNIEKLGVSNPMQSDFIKNKFKDRIKEKWSTDNISKLEITKAKVRKTNQQKFGVDYISQLYSCKQSLSSSMLVKSDRLNSLKKKVLEKKLNKKVANFNLKFLKIIDTSKYLIRCSQEHEFEIHKTTLNDRIRNQNRICTICNPINGGSDAQFELFEFISSIYQGRIEFNYRGFKKYELDIYLPDIGIAFEYNGLYWHSNKYKNKYYHHDKKSFFVDKKIQLFNIWEDDWISEKAKIKSLIEFVLNSSIKFETKDSVHIKNFQINKFIYFSYNDFDLFVFISNGFIVDRISDPIFNFVYKNKRIQPTFTFAKFNFLEHKLITIAGIWDVGIHRLIYTLR